MNEYTVRIVLSELTIVAESSDRAEEIAADILNSDAHTANVMTLRKHGLEGGELR